MTGELLKAGKVLKAGQTVSFYIEGEPEQYTSRIQEVNIKSMVVAAPKDSEGEELQIQPLAEFMAMVTDTECRYTFPVVFERQAKRGRNINVWYVTKPEHVKRHQGRDYVRVRLDHTVQLRLVDDEGTISDPIDAQVVDLSGNGLCFAIDRVVLTGTQVGLEIDNIPDLGPVDVMGRVVRCWPVNPEEEHPIYHVGVSFGELPRATVNKIVHYLFSVQRTSIAKGVLEGGWKA